VGCGLHVLLLRRKIIGVHFHVQLLLMVVKHGNNDDDDDDSKDHHFSMIFTAVTTAVFLSFRQ
jgi:hypothetical protein